MMLASNLMAARQQMAFTLGVHIILVPFGVAFPFITLIANYRAIKNADPDALRLARRWSKVMAVLFAVGAVTGTVLSFEMGLLWPGLFDRFGAVIGIPFAIEGLFFFLEAIFIAIYIYGWTRLSPWAHFWSGVPIVVSGIGGAFSVVTANGWMNQPSGFTLRADGTVTNVRPLAAIFNAATKYEVPHMLLAAYMVAGFVVASVYAVAMLKGRRDRYHRLGFTIAFTVAAIATPFQIAVGDYAARAIHDDQPAKFAAMELVTATGTNRALHLGGVLVDGKVRGAITIPGLDSILAGGSRATRVVGLDDVPVDERPPANLVHLSFQAMVAIGFTLVGLAAWFGLGWWRRKTVPASPWFLRGAAAAGVASVAALEAGWVTTELGRQPWIAYKLMRTSAAVTHVGGVWVSYGIIVVLYAAVITGAVVVLRHMARRWREEELSDLEVPYGPRPQLVADVP